MNNSNLDISTNPLATEKISKLLLKFSIPAIISGLVGALYNIVDQIFIGQSVGILGNAATNVAFPIFTICLAASLLSGIGTATSFSLSQGRGEIEKAKITTHNGLFFAIALGIFLSIITLSFLPSLLYGFGSTDAVFPYAKTYTGIAALGFPFFVFSTAASFLIRADGSPKFSMITMLSGAITNTILDPILIFTFDMGIAGGAWATVIGQFLSFTLAVYYFIFKFNGFKLKLSCILKPSFKIIKEIMALGMGPATNQLTLMFVQVTSNNILTYYGERSIYGGDIPLATTGIIVKVFILYISIVIGIAQGSQPIFGFNYGAKNYERVKETYKTVMTIGVTISSIAWALFQLFPREIISVFGEGTEEYFIFGEKLFKIYLFFTFVNAVQPLTGTFFTSIGKAKFGIAVSLTRQFLFLIPLLIIFPRQFGIEGYFYTGPVADVAAFFLAVYLGRRELKILDRLIIERDSEVSNIE